MKLNLFPPAKYKKSYSQCGEDMIIDFLFYNLKIISPRYLDIGANDPIRLSNTYYFYEKYKASGVLVEPNSSLCKQIKQDRARDLVLCCGVGFSDKESMADYYEMDWHEFNTFSKEVAYQTQEHYNGKNNVKNVSQVKLVNVNSIFKEYFHAGLDLLSIDVEGLDLEILKSIDFKTYIPKVICVEIKASTAEQNSSDISEYLISKNYTLYAKTPINGIFVHSDFQVK